MAIGYAVTVRGEIDVRTVGPTEISAMVNWLAAGEALPHSDRIMVYHGVPDEHVTKAFSPLASHYGAQLAEVEISVLSYIDAPRRAPA